MKHTQASLSFHKKLQGKLEIRSTVSLKTKKNLTLAYTPGVGKAVEAIVNDPQKVNDLTIKQNCIAVITDGSSVLGYGNVGPEAALPVMEGKCAIFKEFAGINAFPICLKTQKVDEIISIVKNIAPVFGGINLEDISAPRCFEIEKRLQNIGIPVMHDDQHATAIVVLAGLINATKVVGKNLRSCKVVIVGAGAAGTAILKLLNYVKIKNIIILDSEGIISKSRQNLPDYKRELLTISDPNNIKGELEHAAKGADILIGVSKKNLFTKSIIQSLNKNPIVFALANPDPEVLPSNAKKWGVKVIATGRSDYPNQINNALVFPGFFKGLLESGKTKITNGMKVQAAKAFASLIKKPSVDKFIPSIFDRRVVSTIAKQFI